MTLTPKQRAAAYAALLLANGLLEALAQTDFPALQKYATLTHFASLVVAMLMKELGAPPGPPGNPPAAPTDKDATPPPSGAKPVALALMAWAFPVLAIACGASLTNADKSDLLVYETQQEACIAANPGNRAAIDACRAEVRARWCKEWAGRFDAGVCP